MKKKTYVLMLSKVFPATHPRAGEPTGFKERVCRAVTKTYERFLSDIRPKVHTIRANYDYWSGIFEEIEADRAELSLREWEGKPYRSKQVEFARLTREDGIGLQKFEGVGSVRINGRKIPDVEVIANNDGLSLVDWEDWFASYDLSKPMAIIQFTEFRY